MNTNLTVTDPLAEQEVTIIITFPASTQPRDERPVLISVGVAEQLPMTKTGKFGEMATLIDEAWTAFSVRAQVTESVQEGEAVTEEQLLATASADDDMSVPIPQPHQAAPKPQAKNLSLF
ncbi:MAG: hypothetical protein GY942_13780 [Aestuariibacter sp.]|nr:hypothetical protein [Aestuariibacter sp.]